MQSAEINKYYKVDYQRMLGEGGYSKVFFARNRKTKRPVAIKVFTVTNKADLVDVKAEVGALKKLSNENVVGCIETFESEVYYFVVLEYIEGGHSLIDLFMSKKANKRSMNHLKVTEKNVQHIIRQVTEGLFYAMTKKICHRDVKLDNVLVRDFQTFDVVLADFNFSKELDTTKALMKTKLGTPGFKAPEILAGIKYDYKCDIWSLGVMFYALISWGQPPYMDYSAHGNIRDYEETFKNLPKLDLEFIPEEQFKYFSEEGKVLLKGMLTVNPKRRFKYKRIKSEKWYRNDRLPDNTFNLNQDARSKAV